MLAIRLSQYPNGWSRAGRVLIYTELHPDTGADLWALEDGKPRPLVRTRFDEDFGILSPDGRWFAYESNEATRWEVYVRPWPGLGTRWQVSTAGGYAPMWSPDGRTLFFQADGGALLAVDVAGTAEPFAAARPRVITRDPQSVWYGVAGDGRLLSIRRPAVASTAPIHVVQGWSAELAQP